MDKPNKKRIGTITFHSSYNYGSALQAYALQEYILKEYGTIFDYDVINFRTKRQKDLYDKPFGFYDYKSIIRKVYYFRYKKLLLRKRTNFENFFKNYLNITDEYSTEDELAKAPLSYDYYISGSDQIWNYSILDFDWSFFLEFCNNGKKISYAASLGPSRLDISKDIKNRIKKDLAQYSKISVRETRSLEIIEKITERNDICINIDPTLLLKKATWEKLAGDRLIDDNYIFLYDLKSNKEAYAIADFLSRKYNMPVVVVKNKISMDKKCKNIIRKYDAGPIEFLNYIRNAKIIVSSSFHGNVFSIIFERPFLAIGGKQDARTGNLLSITGLLDRSVDNIENINALKKLFKVNFAEAKQAIAKEQKNTEAYFNDALDIERMKNE